MDRASRKRSCFFIEMTFNIRLQKYENNQSVASNMENKSRIFLE